MPGTLSPDDALDRDRLLDVAVSAFYAAQVEHAHLIQHLAVTHDLNPVDLRAPKFLGAVDEDRTPKELGAYLEMGTGAVTALLDRLAKRGLLDRVRNPNDRRSVQIELSVDGFAIVGVLRSAYRRVLEQSLQMEHVDTFIQFTEGMSEAFRKVSTEH
ncbi:MarR family winged helix-turn-helix transcriptional regulator [Curtobacterium sp. VKM Ac-1376]|uniref:MarR family winged helix-turn-helix transcriptional regulator n=1 Tax=Curtobacterium sp. VKM Ac-1376 TaxID=123312 RepID=UPI00188A5142|nr:MarR family transcriptional regulator [Curtobacterium sp. VKM Ac-1376]MBF4616437.1 MarR family transcriptional regulator [Curtobacterium sp. VKM Ac-1376]